MRPGAGRRGSGPTVGDLSAHFSSHEFVDRVSGHKFGPPLELLQVLEKIRALRGKPVRIVSGHRCCARQLAEFDAPESRHIAGDGVDLVAGVATVEEAVRCGAVGVGERGGWAVHVDVRPGPAARWSY